MLVPEDAVADPGVEVEVHLLEVLEQDSPMAVDDRLRQAGRPRGVEDPEGVVEGDPDELERLVAGHELVPGERALDAAGAEVGQEDDVLEARKLLAHALDGPRRSKSLPA